MMSCRIAWLCVCSVEAYLSSVPNDSMLILDLYTDAQPVWQDYNSYFGKPFAWCKCTHISINQSINHCCLCVGLMRLQLRNS